MIPKFNVFWVFAIPETEFRGHVASVLRIGETEIDIPI